jgi:hypothetical protein
MKRPQSIEQGYLFSQKKKANHANQGLKALNVLLN